MNRLKPIQTFIANLAAFIGFFVLEYVAMSFMQGSIYSSGQQRLSMLAMGLILAVVFVRFGFRAINGQEQQQSRLTASIKAIKMPNWSEWKMIALAYILGWSGMVIWNEIEVMFFYNLTHGTTENQSAIDSLMKLGGTYSLVIFSIIIVFIGPVLEEVLFRGLFFRYFNSKKFPWLVVALSGLSFGIYHLGSYDWVSLLDLPPYLIIGLSLAYVYKKSGKLSSSIAMHMFHNGWIQIITIATLIH